MDRYTAISIAAAAAIAAPFAVSGADIVGAEQMQYRWDSPGMFSFFKMATDGSLEFCNTLPFWASFESMDITMYYQNNLLGTYHVGPLTMEPLASSVHKGTFRSDHIASAHSIFMTLDFGIADGEAGIDPKQFAVQTMVSTPILGLIPYHTTSQTTGLGFDQLMRADDLYCN